VTTLRIDISAVAAAVALGVPTQKEADQILRGLGAAAYAAWVKLAQNTLHSTSRDYIGALQLDHYPKREEVVLTGLLPNMIENGWPGGDMRGWMLKSPKAKTAADGSRYLAVPFRHGTPGTGGRNVGNAMPPEIYRVAKNLAPTLSVATTHSAGRMTRHTSWGGRLSPHQRGLRKDTKETLNRLLQPWHKTSIYTSMVKRVTHYPSGASSTTYQTFRTISSKPPDDPRSWMHGGIVARNLGPKVQVELSSLLSRAVWKAINTDEP